MKRDEATRWTMAELADKADVPARSIRFYIARGLLPGPVNAGRGAAYTEKHLIRLKQIKKLQADGLMLAEISLALDGKKQKAPPSPSAWWKYEISDDVVVMVRADVSPWRLKQVRKALAEMAAHLGKVGKTGERNNAGE